MRIDLHVDESVGEHGTPQQMIDPEPRIAPIRVPEIIPERVDDLAGMECMQRIGPGAGRDPPLSGPPSSESSIPNSAAIDHLLDKEAATCRVIVETPKGPTLMND